MGSGQSAAPSAESPMGGGCAVTKSWCFEEQMRSVEAKMADAARTKALAKSASQAISAGCEAAAQPDNLQGGCPVSHGTGDLDPKNMMPAPNQRAAPDQPFPLPTDRVVSSIPKADADGQNWTYPSQQMFWNAMLRKGWRWKEEDLKPKDMDDIIRIHNFNNEKAWREVLLWERFRHPECQDTKLRSFKGNALKYTPRARFRHQVLGRDLPFDRHDWLIDRCGKEVHYVIDYYDGGPADPTTGDFALLDVRPAVDSFGNFWDRLVTAYARRRAVLWGIRYSGEIGERPKEQSSS